MVAIAGTIREDAMAQHNATSCRARGFAMVNIVRRTNDKTPAPTFSSDWDPFSAMRQLMRWGTAGFDPFVELPRFESVSSAALASYMPAFEVKENKEGYSFKADLPGVKEEDLKITITGDRLSISGKRDEEKKRDDETCYCYERSYGSFTRVFTLPSDVDSSKPQAELKNGQLTLLLARKPDQQPKQITVKVGDK